MNPSEHKGRTKSDANLTRITKKARKQVGAVMEHMGVLFDRNKKGKKKFEAV